MFHSFQPVDEFSLDQNSVSSLNVKVLNADKKTICAHPEDTQKWIAKGTLRLISRSG